MYALIKDNAVAQYPYGPDVLRRDNPNVSFPLDADNALLAEWGVHPVEPRNPPEFDRATQNCQRVNPTQEGGAWVETWSVTSATPEQIEQRRKEQAASVRAARNQKLAQSDWTQVLDAPVDKAAWATYRQALRDITSQAGFPFDVQWPQAPN